MRRLILACRLWLVGVLVLLLCSCAPSVDVTAPIPVDLTLTPGMAIDPEYGFCKWSWYSEEPMVIWGHVNDVSVSPFGQGLPYRVGDLVPSQYGQCRIIAGDPCNASDENAVTQRMGWIRVRIYE